MAADRTRFLRVALTALLAGAHAVAAQPARLIEPVSHPLDGDTLVMASGEVVRLANVDTPEIACQCPSECRRALAAFTIARDETAAGVELQRSARRDRYGRTIARVVLPDGRDLGELLISRGLGRPYRGERRASWCP